MLTMTFYICLQAEVEDYIRTAIDNDNQDVEVVFELQVNLENVDVCDCQISKGLHLWKIFTTNLKLAPRVCVFS